MPTYYSNDNVAPFSQGMLIGFELFDRARARRSEAEDRKRALAQEDERMVMAREDQDMQRKTFVMAEEDRDINLERQRVADLDKQRLTAGSSLGELAAVYGGLDKAPREEVIRMTREGDPTRYASASDDDVYAGATALMLEGSDYAGQEAIRQRQREEGKADRLWELNTAAGIQEAQRKRLQGEQMAGLRGFFDLVGGPEEAAAPAAGIPPPIIKDTTPSAGGQRGGVSRGAAGATTTGSATAAPPTSLVAAQAARDAAPRGKTSWETLTEKGGAPRNPYAQSKWLPIANPDAQGGANARRNPEAIVDDWLQDRDQITNPQVRAPLDELAAVGIQRKIERLRTQPGSASEIARLEAQARSLQTDAARAHIVAEAPRPVAPGPQAGRAIEAAVAAQGSMTPKATQDQQRVLLTQFNRMVDSPPKRLTHAQMETLARAVVVGAVPMEAALSLATTGSATKPEKATYHNAGEGRFLVTRGDKVVGIVDASDAPAVDGQGRPTGSGSLKDTERRQRHEYNSKFATDQLVAAYEGNDFSYWLRSDPSQAGVVAGFFKEFTAAVPELERRYNMRLTDPETGSATLGHLDQGQVARLIDWYIEQQGDNRGRSLADYGPAPAAQDTAGDDGWQVVMR
jgi:hypothetical protein